MAEIVKRDGKGKAEMLEVTAGELDRNEFLHEETEETEETRQSSQRGVAATKASFPSRVPLPASSCGERETRSAGEGRFTKLDLPSAAPSSAFGTFSPARNRGGEGLSMERTHENRKRKIFAACAESMG